MNANELRVGSYIKIGGMIRKATARDIRLLEDIATEERFKPQGVKLTKIALKKMGFSRKGVDSLVGYGLEITQQEINSLKWIHQFQMLIFVKNNFIDLDFDLFEIKES
jgi:hypothetical protein